MGWRLGVVSPGGHGPGPCLAVLDVGQVVRRLCDSTEDCEVDPSKCPAAELPQHQARLQNNCEDVFQNIIHSHE